MYNSITPRRTSAIFWFWVVTFIPSLTRVVHEAGRPFIPSICTRQSRQEPNASSCSVAHSFGTFVPTMAAARITDVPAGTARNTLRIHERLVLARRNLGVESAALDGQRKGTLLFVTRAYAARADDALAGIEREVRIARVLAQAQVILAFVAIAHFTQTNGTGHVLQLAVTVGRAGEAVERMVGDV